MHRHSLHWWPPDAKRELERRTKTITRPDLLQSKPGEFEWLDAVRAAVDRAPEPDRAQTLASSVLEGAPDPVLAALGAAPAQTVGQLFFALCGVAPFFTSYLKRYPSWLSQLCAEDYGTTRTAKELAARLDEKLAGAASPADLDECAAILRRFKYYELARITMRDCCESWLPLDRSGETLDELSQLADLLLDRSLAAARENIGARLGPALWSATHSNAEPIELAFCVLGLGKLGSSELNYSSDVDLIYTFESPPIAGVELAPDGASTSPVEYFTRLAQVFGRIVGDTTSDGFLYRIDLDLRPEGAQGNIVVSDASLCDYYESWADTWEKAAFMKARPVAGVLQLGWSAIRSVDPMIYRSSMDFVTVDGIRQLKDKIESAHGNDKAGFNVKIDSGGIRDIEFIAQSMQLLHGGRIEQLRTPSTRGAIERLAAVGVLPADEAAGVIDSYRFLRRVENRLQMEAERQTHVLAPNPESLERMARALEDDREGAGSAFEALLQSHRDRVVNFFDSLFGSAEAERVFELFARNIPNLATNESLASMLQRLSERFARQIHRNHESERALNNLDRFIQGVGSRRFFFELLLDRPELVERLARMFAASKFLSSVLASHPELIEPVFADPAVLIPSPEAMDEDLRGLIEERTQGAAADDVEGCLDALRLFMNRQILNAGLLDLSGKIDRSALESALTEIAECCVRTALRFARKWIESGRASTPESARAGQFLIVGMGKLASRELGYGSDLDVIFIFDCDDSDPANTPEAQHYFVRLAQRFISTLQTSTAEGACYEIDARLRPSGNQGVLVSSLASFERYHESSAQVWERQAMLRARAIVGEPALVESFEALRLEILRRELPPDLGAEVHRVRQRMELELAHETAAHHNFKTGRGGVLDVECAVQFLQLSHGQAHPELLSADRLEAQLVRLSDLDLLEANHHRALHDGWDFLQRLGSRLRIVENRSISDLDEERGDLEGLALRLGYPPGSREGGARRAFLRDYKHHTEAIRAAYLAILGIDE